MKTENFKPLTVDDFKLTPKELKLIVDGAQRVFPPANEEGEPLPTAIDNSPEEPTS